MAALRQAPAVVPLPPSPSRAHVVNINRQAPDGKVTFQTVDRHDLQFTTPLIPNLYQNSLGEKLKR